MVFRFFTSISYAVLTLFPKSVLIPSIAIITARTTMGTISTHCRPSTSAYPVPPASFSTLFLNVSTSVLRVAASIKNMGK